MSKISDSLSSKDKTRTVKNRAETEEVAEGRNLRRLTSSTLKTDIGTVEKTEAFLELKKQLERAESFKTLLERALNEKEAALRDKSAVEEQVRTLFSQNSFLEEQLRNLENDHEKDNADLVNQLFRMRQLLSARSAELKESCLVRDETIEKGKKAEAETRRFMEYNESLRQKLEKLQQSNKHTTTSDHRVTWKM